MSAKHTPGPWTAYVDDSGSNLSVTAGGVTVIGGCGCCGSPFMGGGAKADARLIAAAPDYHDAAFWIHQAVSSNAAPIDPLSALEEMALDGKHITLDAGLVLDLLKAHTKATGGAA